MGFGTSADWRAITDGMADGLLVAGGDGAILYVNPSGLRMLGYDAEEELLTRQAHDTVPGTGADRHAGGRHGEDDFRRRDGSRLPVASSSAALPLADGIGTVICFRDVRAERAATAVRHDAERQVRHSETLHQTLTANLPDTTVFLLDRELRVLIADGEAVRRLPWLDEDMFRGRKVLDLYAEVPEAVLRLCAEHYGAALQGERRTFEFLSDGLTFAVQAVPVRADDETVESVLVVARDVTERARVEQRLARYARQQNAVADLGRFALQSHDLGALIRQAVTTAAATLDVDIAGVLQLSADGSTLNVVASVGVPDHLLGAGPIPLIDSAHAAYTLRAGRPTIVEDFATETRFAPSPALLELGVVSSLSVLIEGHGEPSAVLSVHAKETGGFSEEDVAFLSSVSTLITVAIERQRDERATRHAALHDPLTGLPNRTLALDRLAHALARRRRDGVEVAVFVLDVDRFKMINDSFGHAAGDEVLLALAARLTDVVRPSDTVARLGGDEFVVICTGMDAARGAAELAERLAAAVRRPLTLDSGEHFFTISIGITFAAGGHDTPESLLGDADAAMYEAKEHGHGRYELFDEALRTSVMSRLRTESELRRALDRQEFMVWYQPVVDLATGRTVATEALVRWNHPERGLVPPLDFIPIAEDSGLIAELGLYVLEVACRQTAEWQQHLDCDIGVSVNVSGRQVLNPEFPAQVAAIMQRSRLRAGTLALEITETVLMAETGSAETVLASFQQHGLTLALDDFGTGYSSLSRLKRFPLDMLKIDRSFVSDIERNGDDRAIVKATIDMAHALSLVVVAEGVEARGQEDHLRAFGCDRVQGYLYARPQAAAAITGVLAAAVGNQ